MADLLSEDEELLADLLLDWEDSQSSPPPKSPEELCHERMDLADELKRRIEMLASINRLMIDHSAETGLFDPSTDESFARANFPQIPGYEILSEIGRGGMGIVYKARQLSVKRFVAIKAINSAKQNQKELSKRLRREADALGSLNHEHVVRVHDVISLGETVCLVLEYIDGRNLAQRETGSAIDPRSAAEIALTVAKTMADVHRTGLLHRDLKPANLMRDQSGTIKVSDFGLAKYLENDSFHTATGEGIGTPSYMAPEQAFGVAGDIGQWSDVYGIGATLYDLMTGRPPFVGATLLATLAQLKSIEPVSPRLLVPEIPVDLETICLKCLAKEPSQRYSSAAALASDLENYLAGKPISARPLNSLELAWRWSRRFPDRAGLIAAIALGFVLTIGLGAWEVTRIHDAANRALTQERNLAAATEKVHVQEFYASLGRINERSTREPTGWSWSNLEDLKRVASIRPRDDQTALHRLRSEAMRALAAFDVRKQRELLQGFDTYTLEYAPNGNRLAAGANQNEDAIVKIALIDTTTWEVNQIVSFPIDKEYVRGRPDGVRSMLFSRDGKELYVGTRSGWIRVFDMVSFRETRQWRGHGDYVFRLRLTSDENSLLSCSKDHFLKKWSLEGQLMNEIHHDCELTDFVVVNNSLDPISSHVAVAGTKPLWLRESDLTEDFVTVNDSTARPIDAQVVARYPDGEGWIRDSGSTFQALNAQSQNPIRTFIDRRRKYKHLGELHGMEISADGRWLVTTNSQSVKLWDLASSDRVSELSSGSRGRVTARFHPTQNVLAVSGDQKITVYELSPASIWQQRLQQSHPLHHITLSPSGDRVAAIMIVAQIGLINQLLVGLTDSCLVVGRLSMKTSLAGTIQFSPGGDEICVSLQQLNLLQSVKADGSEGFNVRSPELIDANILRFSPEGERLYFVSKSQFRLSGTSDRPPGEIKTLDISTRQIQSLFVNNESEQILRASKFLSLAVGSKFLACSSVDQTIRLLDSKLGSVVAKQELPTICDTLSMSSDESTIVAGTRHGDLLVIDIPSGKIRQSIHAHVSTVTAVTFAGPELVVSGSQDQNLKLWKWSKGKLSEILAFGPLSGLVQELAASLDGRIVAVLVEDETAVRLLRVDLLRERLKEYGLDW